MKHLHLVVLAVLCALHGTNALRLPLPHRSQSRASEVAIPDAAYYAMQANIIHALDGVSGRAFIWNWFALLGQNATVCYPFVGIINDDYCITGLTNIEAAWAPSNVPYQGYDAIQQNDFWLSKSNGVTVGVFKYTTSSSYLRNGTACVVQFEGVVMWQLSPTNTSQIVQWNEMPDSNRISSTYPCQV